MKKAEIVNVRCDRCGEPMRKGDDFVVSGKYPGVYRSWLRARWMGVGSLPEDHGEIYHPACYLESLKDKKPGSGPEATP